nr:mitochondrial import inner membrane translocase subunit TIM44-like [Penaeus vannamei]
MFGGEGKAPSIMEWKSSWVPGIGIHSWNTRTQQSLLTEILQCTTSTTKTTNILRKIIENLREEMSRNQKMKESLKEFRKDMEKLEKSEALQKAREKYQSVEEETAEGSKKAKQQLEFLKKRVSETVEEAQKAEILQKASKMTEEATRQAQKVSQTISQKGEELSKTQTFKTISETAKAVKEEIDHSTFGGAGARVYRAPRELRKRVERDPEAEQRIIQANTEASGMVLHKDSQFAQSWQNFKDNNPYVNRVLVWKTKLDESDNPVVRASMLVKDKVSELFGGVFQRTELSEALTEICKMDPTFDKERFLLECEYDMIPNVLEAMIRPDLEILKDWCYERAFSVLATPVKQAYQLGFKFDSKVLDVDNVDLVMGKVMDEGPVLAISFQSQQIMCLRNQKGEVVEGDPSKVLRVQYVWVLCRDQTELDSRAAWRILDLSAQSTEQFV